MIKNKLIKQKKRNTIPVVESSIVTTLSALLQRPSLQRSSKILSSSSSLLAVNGTVLLSPCSIIFTFSLFAYTYLRLLVQVTLSVMILSWILTIAQFSLIPVMPKTSMAGFEFLVTRQLPLLAPVRSILPLVVVSRQKEMTSLFTKS